MSTEFHDEPDSDSSSFWNQDPGLVQYSVWTRSRRWLIPALVSTLVLILIIAFGANSAGLSSRLSSLDESVSNLSLSLSSAHDNNKESGRDLQRLKFSVESNRDQISSVAESLTAMAEVESLSKTVALLKCALDRIIHNRTELSGCCPLQWEEFESSCFFFSKAALSWNDARDWCHAHRSQLLILNTDKDWDFVHGHSLGGFFWVGLTDEGGKWEWVNGTPYTVERRRWRPGQPDDWRDHGLGEGGEDCAHLHSDGRLNDMHCSARLRFICHSHGGQS